MAALSETILLNTLKGNAKPGWTLNPNEKVVSGIMRGLARTGGECPCHNIGETIEDRMCPCKEFRENNHCCCSLYVKDDGSDHTTSDK